MISKDINIKDDTSWYSLLDLVYPIGSIYCSTKATSPASLMGGIWSAISGKFLLGINSTYTLGSTGGAATHKLITDEIPSHTHKVKWYNVATGGSGDTAWNNGGKSWQPSTDGWDGKGGSKDGLVATATGGSKAHNNMPPYQAVSIWERTA